MVEVFGAEEQGQVIMLLHVCGIGEEEVGVGFQMHRSTVYEEVAIALKEECRGETLARVLHLRVAECEPYLLHLILAKEAVDNLDVGAQECHILQSVGYSLCGSCPHTCSLDVNANEVDIGEHLSQPYCIFTLATSQLEHNGVVVLEVHLAPSAFHLKRHVVGYRERILKHVLVSFHVGELRQFSFAHIWF